MIPRLLFYPSLLYNVAMEKITDRRWYDRIDNVVILGALPFRNMTRQLVEQENVKAVIAMNEDYELRHWYNTPQEWQARGVQCFQLSTTDIFWAPSQEKLVEGVRIIESFRDLGGSVYVHCKAGRTRSATLVACYYMKANNWTPEKAISYIRTKREHILIKQAQMEALHTYYNNHVHPPTVHK